MNDTVVFTKQDEAKATVWPERKPEDGEIHASMTMEEAERLVRAGHIHTRVRFIKMEINVFEFGRQGLIKTTVKFD